LRFGVLPGRQASREYPLFSRKEEKALRKVSQPLRLCAFARVLFFYFQRKKACLPQAGFARVLFFSRKEEKALRKVSQPLRLCESIFFRLSKKESLPTAGRAQRKKGWDKSQMPSFKRKNAIKRIPPIMAPALFLRYT
jgi:hypothetical protein